MVASPFGKQGSQASGKKLCNCKNSRCLKLYCECFASGRFCDNCNCSKCANNEAHSSQRTAAVQQILERNPHAFRPKVPDGVQSSKHSKGCNCRKSGCLKKYCECFQAGVVCSDNCKCNDCKNFEGSVTRANVLQYLEDREQGVNVTPSKRQRVEPVLEAGKQERVPRAASGSTVGHSGTVAGRPGVLQGVLTPDAIWELCKLLLFSVNEVATHAGQRAAREAAAGAVAVPHAASSTQGNSIPSGVGERGGEDQLEASLYCNENTEELGMGRDASERAATIPPAAALDPALLYEQQEGRVLKEFLETMQSIVTLGEQRAQQLQPHQRVLFPDMGQPSSSAAAGGVQHTHAQPKPDAAHASSQHAWEATFSQIHLQQQALISDLQWPANGLTPFAAIAPSRLQRGDAVASLPLPLALLNGPSEEMQALQVMHNGQLILIPTSNASLVAMPQGSALQQRIASSPTTGRQAPRVGSGSGPSTAVVSSLPVPKEEPGMLSTGAPERGALTSPSSFDEGTVHSGRDSLPNGRTRKHERGL